MTQNLRIAMAQFDFPVGDVAGNAVRIAEMIAFARDEYAADVVEAICSRRSYRSALGIEKALKEILQYRDVLYDGEAVDACVALFRDRGFRFK